ncbi:hypothetical protein ACC703_39140, partial [Rhizobium ruizarguesonis]
LLTVHRDGHLAPVLWLICPAVKPNVYCVRRDGNDLAQHAFDHGYATTIQKTKGATVDRSFVLASTTMDRNLTYVAMTRHREGV